MAIPYPVPRYNPMVCVWGHVGGTMVQGEIDMMVVGTIKTCFCGWTGEVGVLMRNGQPVCPSCLRVLSVMRCEGCSD